MSTPYHAKYLAYELTKRCSSEKLGKLTQSIFNATVDLNPHQIEAALFAFRSPLSRGAILADEVGLGKTIEAGLREGVGYLSFCPPHCVSSGSANWPINSSSIP